MKKLNFEIEQADMVDENPDSQFATAKIRAFSSGRSRNDTYCSEDALKKTAHTIFDKPILYNVNKMFDDFNTHADPSNSLITGFVVPESASFERLEDNRLSLNVIVKLWKRYAPKAMEIFQRDGGKKKVSVEVDLVDSEETDDGLLDMKNFIYSGICILGDLVKEGSPGAQLEMLSFSEANEDYKKAVELEFGTYEHIDLSIPENVKKNISKGMDLYKQYNKGGTSVSLASARYMLKSNSTTPEKLRHVAKIHSSGKFKNMVKNPPNDEYISYMLYGGKDGMEWSKNIECQLNEQDTKNLSYFSNEISFPYKSLKDINPALAGIDPPITLGQANEIARQADAIGTDEKKKGWAIAISSFKKTHKVEDGKWVKKEKMSYDFSLNSSQILEIFNSHLAGYTYGENKYPKYWVLAYDDDEKYVFFRDSEEGKTYRTKYNLTGNECSINLDSKEEVINAGFMTVKEASNMEDLEKEKIVEKFEDKEPEKEFEKEPEKEGEKEPEKEGEKEPEKEFEKEPEKEEDKKDEEEDEKESEEDKKENMSADLNLDVAAYLATLANETDAYAEMVKGELSKPSEERNYAKLFESMCGKMCTMASDNQSLKSFKESVEKKQFEFEVQSTLKEIKEHSSMPQEKMDALIEESKKFSIDNVDNWKNYAKSEALSFAKKSENEDEVLRIGNHWGASAKKTSIWD